MNSRAKGKRGELEFARLCREHGYDVRRTAQYCGNTGEASDVVGLPGIHAEVKRVERLDIYAAVSQAQRDAKQEEKPVVFHRKNNHGWLVTMPFEVWVELYREWEAGRKGPGGDE